jgi:hypothetical protein
VGERAILDGSGELIDEEGSVILVVSELLNWEDCIDRSVFALSVAVDRVEGDGAR